jgi:hypothetical protein
VAMLSMSDDGLLLPRMFSQLVPVIDTVIQSRDNFDLGDSFSKPNDLTWGSLIVDRSGGRRWGTLKANSQDYLIIRLRSLLVPSNLRIFPHVCRLCYHDRLSPCRLGWYFQQWKSPDHSRSRPRIDRARTKREMVCLISRLNRMELISLYISHFGERLKAFVMAFWVEIRNSNASGWHREFWKIRSRVRPCDTWRSLWQ